MSMVLLFTNLTDAALNAPRPDPRLIPRVECKACGGGGQTFPMAGEDEIDVIDCEECGGSGWARIGLVVDNRD